MSTPKMSQMLVNSYHALYQSINQFLFVTHSTNSEMHERKPKYGVTGNTQGAYLMLRSHGLTMYEETQHIA